jgi:hypothetical protein
MSNLPEKYSVYFPDDLEYLGEVESGYAYAAGHIRNEVIAEIGNDRYCSQWEGADSDNHDPPDLVSLELSRVEARLRSQEYRGYWAFGLWLTGYGHGILCIMLRVWALLMRGGTDNLLIVLLWTLALAILWRTRRVFQKALYQLLRRKKDNDGTIAVIVVSAAIPFMVAMALNCERYILFPHCSVPRTCRKGPDFTVNPEFHNYMDWLALLVPVLVAQVVFMVLSACGDEITRFLSRFQDRCEHRIRV